MVELENYLIDVCITAEEDGKPKVQMVSYLVTAENPMEALDKFVEKDASEFKEVYRGEPVTHIIVGLQPHTK